MSFTGRDILLSAYPVLNQNGITPLISEGGFVQSINNAISNSLIYKGYIWSFQNTRQEFTDNILSNKTLTFTLDNPILTVIKFYVDRGNGYEEYEMKRVPSSYILADNTYSYDTSGQVVNLRISNSMVKKISILYYRGQKRINVLDEEINLPDIIRPAISYFTLSELIPIYHSYEQGRDINYIRLATQYLEWLRQTDSIEGDRVEATLL